MTFRPAPRKCPYCLREFTADNMHSTTDYLVGHLLANHGWQWAEKGKRKYRCKLCHKGFLSWDGIAGHLRDYKCPKWDEAVATLAVTNGAWDGVEEKIKKERPKKPKPSVQEVRTKRAAELLASWERKLKLAKTKCAKYRKRCEYYRRAKA